MGNTNSSAPKPHAPYNPFKKEEVTAHAGFIGGKVIRHSKVLGRDFHMDVFKSRNGEPEWNILIWGGSGKTQKDYEKRKSLISKFPPPNLTVASEVNLKVIYITAPYDIAFNRFEEAPLDLKKWERHVEEDILSTLSDAPIIACGFSGGFGLATYGLSGNKRCHAFLGLGADEINEKATPKPFYLYYNKDDGVRNAPGNKVIFDRMEAREQVVIDQSRRGGHKFDDYMGNGTFSVGIKRIIDT